MDLKFINELTVGQFFLISVTIFLLGYMLSFGLAILLKDRLHEQKENMITTNVLGMLVFILGFSFTISLSRFEYRRNLAIAESNAIGTAYLTSKLFTKDQGIERRQLYSDYIDRRMELYGQNNGKLSLLDVRESQELLWNDFTTNLHGRTDGMATAYLNALNEMIETASERNFALEKMLPVSFYLFILIITLSGVGLMTFDGVIQGNTNHGRSFIFIFLLSLLISFIYDMDHYRTGMIQISQDSLLRIKSIL